MKKIAFALLTVVLISYMGSCTSNGTDDLDVLTPNDSIGTSVPKTTNVPPI